MPCQDIWHMIECSLQSEPASACIKCGDVVLSRSQVQAEIERIAPMLNGRRVGIHLPRSLHSVLLTLAVWRNGGVYVPIAADCPLARAQAIAQSCNLDLVIAGRPLDLPGYATAVLAENPSIFLHTQHAKSPSKSGDEALCYIAHTSGSTNSPKGVRVSHASLINRIVCMRRFLCVEPDDRILYKTSPIFDVHIWEFTLPLAAGCLLVIYPQTRLFDLPEVARIMGDDAITIAGFVPALLRLLLDMSSFVLRNSVRALLCGGEAWGPALARDFHARLPGRKLFNSYGPAETTIAVANWPVPNDADLGAICLGQPLPNVAFLIEDELPGAALPSLHVTGALCVGGAQVAFGYVESRGGDRFFEREIDGHVMRFYATGDQVRLDRTTGSIHFKGRQDNQVKVNGMRIELEEIEEAVRAVSLVENCVAFIASPGQFAQLCVAYKSRGNIEIRSSDIRQTCARLLPAAFVPTRLKQVESFPLAETGKVNRSALIETLQEFAR